MVSNATPATGAPAARADASSSFESCAHFGEPSSASHRAIGAGSDMARTRPAHRRADSAAP